MSGGGRAAAAVGRAWAVAASIAVVEALKDHGIARWNYPIRVIHQKAKNNVKSYYNRAVKVYSGKVRAPAADRARRLEVCHGKVMELSSFGPNRF